MARSVASMTLRGAESSIRMWQSTGKKLRGGYLRIRRGLGEKRLCGEEKRKKEAHQTPYWTFQRSCPRYLKGEASCIAAPERLFAYLQPLQAIPEAKLDQPLPYWSKLNYLNKLSLSSISFILQNPKHTIYKYRFKKKLVATSCHKFLTLFSSKFSSLFEICI